MIAFAVSLALVVAQAAGAALQLPDAHHIASVPLAARTTNWCGPAALAAVLQYHGEQTTAKQIADAIYLPGFRGSLNLDLLIYARRHGYQASAGSGSVRQLREAIARDRPVICMVRHQGLLASTNHMVVVRGYDLHAGVWFIDAGEGREQTLKAADFDAEWAKADRWMLVVEGKQTAQPERQERPRA